MQLEGHPVFPTMVQDSLYDLIAAGDRFTGQEFHEENTPQQHRVTTSVAPVSIRRLARIVQQAMDILDDNEDPAEVDS